MLACRCLLNVNYTFGIPAPDWSPDGKWVTYTADEGNRRIQLQILNVETGESRALTDDQHLYLDPVLSPDGARSAQKTH